MKKTLLTMAAVAMMCAMVISGCNNPETQPGVNNAITNPIPTPISLRGSVGGLVVDVRNNPVEGAVVVLLYPGAPAEGVETDASGQYLFQNVPVAGELFWDPSSPQDAQYGNGSPYLITIQASGYATTYTAVLLDYATLAGQGQLTYADLLQGVHNLQSTAITARMPTQSAIVQGRMKNKETGALMGGVLCTLSLPYDFVPNAERIWANGMGTSVHAFANNSTTSGDDGVCSWLSVPEATDADPIDYTLTRSMAGFVPEGCASSGCDEVAVGYGGGHIYTLDSSGSDYDPMTPFCMIPHQGPVDDENPFVVATNIPVGGEIAYANRGENLSVTFNEPMDAVSGRASIEAVNFKNPGPIPLVQSWDAAAQVLTMDPVDELPEGMDLEVSLRNFRDVAQLVYNGRNPKNLDDILTTNSGACTGLLAAGVCVTVTTSGNPNLMQATNLVQVLNPASTAVGPFGGAANNILNGQANNDNVLDPFGTLGLVGTTDTIFLSWTAATPLPPATTGLARQYEVYAELQTGGIIAGLPVLVAETPKSSNPPTATRVSLGTIQAAQVAAGVPITVNDVNVTGLTNYFDEGFALQMAAIAVNSNDVRGPYSNVISADDNVPPTVADLGCGWDSTSVPAVDTCGLAPVNGTAQTNLPIYLLESGWGPTFDVDLQTLAERTGGAGSVTYSAADWTWFSNQGTTITVGMSEDLDRTQNPLPALSLTTSSAASITGATIPGLTDSRREIAIALSGAVLLSPGDTISFANVLAQILDEAGNAANATDATLVFGDAVVPLFTTARAEAAAGNLQRLVASFSEPMSTATGTGDVEDPANYTFTGVLGTDTATYAALTRTVTIVSDNDFQYDGLILGYNSGDPATTIASTNRLTATVEDLNGNVCGQGLVEFLVVDNIQPRILAGFDNTGVPINGGASLWEVGDIHAANDPIGVEFTISEPIVRDVDGDGVWDSADQIASGVSAVVAPALTYFSVANANMTIQSASRVAFLILTNAATVANNDSLRVIGADNAGNNMNTAHDRVVLTGGAGGGYDID